MKPIRILLERRAPRISTAPAVSRGRPVSTTSPGEDETPRDLDRPFEPPPRTEDPRSARARAPRPIVWIRDTCLQPRGEPARPEVLAARRTQRGASRSVRSGSGIARSRGSRSTRGGRARPSPPSRTRLPALPFQSSSPRSAKEPDRRVSRPPDPAHPVASVHLAAPEQDRRGGVRTEPEALSPSEGQPREGGMLTDPSKRARLRVLRVPHLPHLQQPASSSALFDGWRCPLNLPVAPSLFPTKSSTPSCCGSASYRAPQRCGRTREKTREQPRRARQPLVRSRRARSRHRRPPGAQSTARRGTSASRWGTSAVSPSPAPSATRRAVRDAVRARRACE